MNRILIALFFISLVLSPSLSARPLSLLKSSSQKASGVICQLCVQQVLVIINLLLNGILGKTISSCNQLCDLLSNPYEQDLCMGICDAVGLYEFIQFIENKDLDEIYACELVDMCPIDDCTGTCMTITNYKVSPATAKINSDIHNLVTLNIQQAWNGTGMVRLIVTGPSVNTEFDSLIAGGMGPIGTIQFDVPIKTKADGNGDDYEPGVYNTQILICNGECGSTFPHSQLLAQAKGKFTLTE